MTVDAPPGPGLPWPWLAGALAALAGALLVGLALGPVRVPPGALVSDLLARLPVVDVGTPLPALEGTVIWELRAPRVVLGALVGGMLALGGAAYQAVFRNPLADPYLLGVAAGAGLGATLVIAYGPADTSGLVAPAAFAGAVAAVAAAYGLSRSASAARGTATLLLAGVAVAAFLTAAQTFALQQSADTVREVYAWLLGRLETAGWRDVGLVAPYVAVSAAVILLHRRVLDVLRVGDEEAASLGVHVARVRLLLVVAATLGTAGAVAVSGLIGFVGIVVPHAVRLAVGASYRIVLPLSVLLGAAFLVLADVVARVALAPAELPIGVVTACVGAPFFAFLLRRMRPVAP
jgi:iron complex transport system permease protein